MIRVYSIVCDIMRAFIIACAVALLIFFFDKQFIFTKDNIQMVVGVIFTFLLTVLTTYVVIFDRTRYKGDSIQKNSDSAGSAVLSSREVASYNYNRRVSSVHEAGHAVVSYLKNFEKYDVVVTDTEPHIVSVFKAMRNEELKNYIMMLYAGAAAEELFFGIYHAGCASGNDSDFKRAVEFIRLYLMMTHSNISKACLDEEVAPYIKELSNDMYKEVTETLSENKWMVEAVANELEVKGFLTTKEIKELINRKEYDRESN